MTTRVSTAEGGSPAYLSTLFRRLGNGLVLNVGAGNTRCPTPGKAVVHVDHVAPDAPESGMSVVADAAALPFRRDAFHGVLLKDVLEHMTDCIGALAEVRRVTKTGGRLVVQVPRAIPRAVWGDPTHVRGFTASAVTQALLLSGWELVNPPTRVGGLPGAGRLHLEPWLPTIMKVPVVGHWFGTNWLIDAQAASTS